MSVDLNLDIGEEKSTFGGTAVTFLSEGGSYAFDIGKITEILSEREVTPIPCLPRHILGVINLRGEVIPVIDFRRKLGFPDIPRTGRETFLVIESGGTTAAIRTDSVVTSVIYDESNYMPMEEESIAAGMIISGKEQITLIDTAKLFE